MFKIKAKFKIKANPLRRSRAVTLIEAVLYISIALALIVGGLVFFQQASTAAKTSAMVRQLSATLAEGRVVMKGLPNNAAPFNITSLLIAAGAVPPSMVHSATQTSNPFGGTTEYWAINVPGVPMMIQLVARNIPQGVCARLLTATSGSEYVSGSGGVGGTTLVSSGYVLGSAAATGGPLFDKNFIMNPTQAGWMCKYGGASYVTKTTQPGTAPIPGNVDVLMVFLVDA